MDAGAVNEDDDKAGLSWYSNDDDVHAEIGAVNYNTFKGVAEDKK